MKKINLYIGHKLTGADPMFLTTMNITFTSVFAVLTNCIRVPFLGLKWSDPIEVYNADIRDGIGRSDLVVLVFDERSDGIIIELCAALWLLGVPVLVIYKSGTKLPGLDLGIFKKFPDQIMERQYTSVNDIVSHIQEAIAFFKLDTLHPARFACIESMKPSSVWCREAPIYGGLPQVTGNHGEASSFNG
jgi:hypothetical protein